MPDAEIRPSIPDALKWIVGIFVVIIIIWCINAGINSTLIWLSWVGGSALVPAVLMGTLSYFGNMPIKAGMASNVYQVIYIIGGIISLGFALLAGFMLLVGIFGAAKFVLNPFFDHNSEDPDGPQNWRR